VDRVGFDFAVAEDCQVYSECGAYRRLYGGHVIEIEYSDEGRANFDQACDARGDVWSIAYRDRDLVTPGDPGYVHDAC
jgi:Glycoside-hydrolase family GH114